MFYFSIFSWNISVSRDIVWETLFYSLIFIGYPRKHIYFTYLLTVYLTTLPVLPST
jgi:hypothetical protein